MSDLMEYAKVLVAEGFEVWHTKSTGRSGGWLTYRNPKNDCWGTLQLSEYDGWQHLMPIKPSRENGSSMHVQDRRNPNASFPAFSVEAARQCAQPTNWNAIVGEQQNAPAYISRDAVRIDTTDTKG